MYPETKFNFKETTMYVAKLTGNRREIYTMTPKVLLLDAKEIGSTNILRDHCWVKITKQLEDFIPRGNRNQPIYIQFTAKKKPYMRGGIEEALTLTAVKSIKVLTKKQYYMLTRSEIKI